MKIDVNNLEYFFNENGLKSVYSYISFIDQLKEKFSLNLEEILIELINLDDCENKFVIETFYACMNSNDFSHINLYDIYFNNKNNFTSILEIIFSKYENSYINFPLNQFTDDVHLYLAFSTLMLRYDTFSTHHICSQGLNKISLMNGEYTESTQNRILDLKLTCSIYK